MESLWLGPSQHLPGLCGLWRLRNETIFKGFMPSVERAWAYMDAVTIDEHHKEMAHNLFLDPNPLQVTTRASHEMRYKRASGGRKQGARSSAPEVGHLKLNVDGAVKEDRQARCGGVLLD